jgi:hypothetical protein
MGFTGYISVCVLVDCVGFRSFTTLHVSAYMAIFKCVGYFYSYFHMPEGFCFAALFLPFFSHAHILHVSIANPTEQYCVAGC